MIVDRKSNTVTVIEVQFSKEALNFEHFFFWWNRYMVYSSMFIGPNVGLIIDCGVIIVSFQKESILVVRKFKHRIVTNLID